VNYLTLDELDNSTDNMELLLVLIT